MTTNYYAYVVLNGAEKVLRYAMDINDGGLTLESTMDLPGGPAPLAVDPSQTYLYVGLRASNEIVSFKIDQATGDLTQIGKIGLDGNPCYLATDGTGRYLLAAYYGDGKATVHPIEPDGTVGSQPSQTVATAEHAHYIETDRSNRFTFVPHTLPENALYQFKFDETTGQLTANDPAILAGEAGAGPRHYVYHPSKDMVYTSNENGSSVTAYHFDTSNGTLSAFQTLSTLPADFSGDNTCAQIHIHPAGKFLYVSNRGHDSIACFALDADTGALTALGQEPSETTPRVFNLDPTGNFLYAAGQGTGHLAAYRIDQQVGTLQPLARYEVGQNPLWVLILGLG